MPARTNATNAPARLKAVIRRGPPPIARSGTRRRTICRARSSERGPDCARACSRWRVAWRFCWSCWRLARHTSCGRVVRRAERAARGDLVGTRRRSPTIDSSRFQASGRPTAETSWQRVSAALDEHIAKWSAMYLDSCEASHLRGEQSAEVLDLRTSCLNECHDEARALTDVLVTADTAAIARSSTAARDLTSVGRCADLDVLRSAVPLPRDPATRAAVTRLRAELRTGARKGRTGEISGCGRRGPALMRPAVEALGYKPLRAELLQLIGLGLSMTEPPEAEQVLKKKAFATSKSAAITRLQAAGDRQLRSRIRAGSRFRGERLAANRRCDTRRIGG